MMITGLLDEVQKIIIIQTTLQHRLSRSLRMAAAAKPPNVHANLALL